MESKFISSDYLSPFQTLLCQFLTCSSKSVLFKIILLDFTSVTSFLCALSSKMGATSFSKWFSSTQISEGKGVPTIAICYSSTSLHPTEPSLFRLPAAPSYVMHWRAWKWGILHQRANSNRLNKEFLIDYRQSKHLCERQCNDQAHQAIEVLGAS